VSFLSAIVLSSSSPPHLSYTRSPLQVRVLSLFVRLEYRLPNLVVGTITRKVTARFALLLLSHLFSFVQERSARAAAVRSQRRPAAGESFLLLSLVLLSLCSLSQGYLRSNAHPRMRARTPVLPDVITDQLRAWSVLC